jgi:hypothetical protein
MSGQVRFNQSIIISPSGPTSISFISWPPPDNLLPPLTYVSYAQNHGLIRDYELPTPEPDSPFRPRKPYRFGTLCATVDNPDQKDQYGSSSVPIYQSSTFKGVDGQYDYTRSGNPTRSHLGEDLPDQPYDIDGFISLNLDRRTPHRQDIFSRSCVRRLVWDGCARCHSPSSQTRRRNHRW